MSKQPSKAEVRARAEEFAAFELLWDEAHEMADAFNAALTDDVELLNAAHAEALDMEAARNSTPEETVPPVVEAPVVNGPQLYVLNGPATNLAREGLSGSVRETLQKAGDPKAANPEWRNMGHKAPNTRALALAVIVQTLGARFSEAQARKALADAKAAGTLHLGSGTPASYVKAFIGNKYFSPAPDAEPAE
jgi:hypothetical protein